MGEKKVRRKERVYVTCTVRIPRKIVEYLDRYCDLFGLTRSEVIRQALASFLEEKTGWRHALD